MSQPLVSVIIPTYNCKRFVEESVRSALQQSVQELEVLLIDDASTDGTQELLRSLAHGDNRIRLLQNSDNIGVAETRNRGFAAAHGQYIAFLDGDDVWLPHKLEKQLALMEATPCDLCYTAYSFIDEYGQAIRRCYQVPRTVDLQGLIRENVIGCSTVLCRRELLRHYKMRSQYAHEDYVLWLELLRDGHTALGVQEPLVRYRILSGSRSGNKRSAARNRWRTYREFLGLSAAESLMAFTHYAWMGLWKHR